MTDTARGRRGAIMASRTPTGLGAGGRALWRATADAHELDAAQQVTLLEACRAKDRLDKLDDLLRGDVDTWTRLVEDIRSDGHIFELRITSALTQANATAAGMKQLIAALRLPDAATGKRPQQRGGARGAYTPSGGQAAGRVSSIDRAQARKSS